MNITTLSKTVSFKWGGHTAIILKISLPYPTGEGAAEEGIRRFYTALCEGYVSAVGRLAHERAESLWRQNLRPVVFTVDYGCFDTVEVKRRGKRAKIRHGYCFLRTEMVRGNGLDQKKRTERDVFLADSGLVVS